MEESSYEEEEAPQEEEDENTRVTKECLEAFHQKDSICEASIFKTVKKYFNAGGTPEEVVNVLAESFEGIGNLARQLVLWLEFCGESTSGIESMVEDHVKDLLEEHFDPKKADTIFSEEGDLPGWLGEMISYPTWRNLFYSLADKHPDCIMLNFTIKLISDAGFTDEISSVSTASQQIDVFSRILKTSVASILRFRGSSLENIISDLVKLVCSSKHTYFYTIALLHQACKDRGTGYKLRYLSQELERRARKMGRDTCYITLAMCGAAAYPTIYQSLTSMLTLSKNALNSGDVTTLYQLYSAEDPPPVAFLRLPQLFELLIDALYSPSEKSRNTEHNDKYIYVLAYGVSVTERWDGDERRSINTKRLEQTINAIEKTHALAKLDDMQEWLCNIETVFKYLKYPVVSMGIIKYCKVVTMDSSYFKGVTDSVPLHLIMIDEIANNHPLHHETVFEFLKPLFERSHEHLQELEQIEIRKMIIDRMVHLLCVGHVIPVIQYMRYCLDNETADKSLIRHFAAEVMEVTTSPYSPEFIAEFLPIAKNPDITAPLRNINESDSISQFIDYCGG
ncbi:hypothetical protein ACHWQZ_G002490 [Mnemiopsis leidyi]